MVTYLMWEERRPTQFSGETVTKKDASELQCQKTTEYCREPKKKQAKGTIQVIDRYYCAPKTKDK